MPRRRKKADEERQRAYEAFLVLRGAGYEPDEIRKVLKELIELGFLDAEIPPLETISDWCCGMIPEIEISPLIKAMYYPKCYEIALEVREKLKRGRNA